jgi:hypothetical protein
MLSATKLKITCALKPEELLPIPAVNGQQRTTLRIKLPDRTLTAEVATKSLRRAQTQIEELGAENVALILQGVLVAGDVVGDAGLAAQPRGPSQCLEKESPPAAPLVGGSCLGAQGNFI